MKINPFTPCRFRTTAGLFLVFALFISPSMARLWADDAQKPVAREKWIVRTYVVSATFFHDDVEFAVEKNQQTFDVRRLLIPRGIKFSPGTSATYMPAIRKLVLVNSPDQIERFEELADTDR